MPAPHAVFRNPVRRTRPFTFSTRHAAPARSLVRWMRRTMVPRFSVTDVPSTLSYLISITLSPRPAPCCCRSAYRRQVALIFSSSRDRRLTWTVPMAKGLRRRPLGQAASWKRRRRCQSPLPLRERGNEQRAISTHRPKCFVCSQAITKICATALPRHLPRWEKEAADTADRFRRAGARRLAG
jgi:hypothetical protein